MVADAGVIKFAVLDKLLVLLCGAVGPCSINSIQYCDTDNVHPLRYANLCVMADLCVGCHCTSAGYAITSPPKMPLHKNSVGVHEEQRICIQMAASVGREQMLHIQTCC